MEQVRIYHITCTKAWNAWTTGEGWSLEPWPGDDSYSEGYDDGGNWYVLPDGYHLDETHAGWLGIFRDGRDRAIPLIDIDGKPALAVGMNGLILQRAE